MNLDELQDNIENLMVLYDIVDEIIIERTFDADSWLQGQIEGLFLYLMQEACREQGSGFVKIGYGGLVQNSELEQLLNARLQVVTDAIRAKNQSIADSILAADLLRKTSLQNLRNIFSAPQFQTIGGFNTPITKPFQCGQAPPVQTCPTTYDNFSVLGALSDTFIRDSYGDNLFKPTQYISTDSDMIFYSRLYTFPFSEDFNDTPLHLPITGSSSNYPTFLEGDTGSAFRIPLYLSEALPEILRQVNLHWFWIPLDIYLFTGGYGCPNMANVTKSDFVLGSGLTRTLSNGSVVVVPYAFGEHFNEAVSKDYSYNGKDYWVYKDDYCVFTKYHWSHNKPQIFTKDCPLDEPSILPFPALIAALMLLLTNMNCTVNAASSSLANIRLNFNNN